VTTPPPKIKPLIVPRAGEAPPPKRRPRALVIVGAVGAAVAALALLTALTARPGDRSLYPGVAGQPKVTIYLVENGFHSDLVLPRAALFARPHPAALAAAAATDKPWVSIGWGDAGFFTGGGVGLGRALDGLRALLAPENRSLVRMEGLPDSPDRLYAGGVRRIELTSAGLEQAITRVDRSLSLETDGQPQRAKAASAPDTAFFKSVEHFNLTHLCNHWTAELLNAAGLPVTPVIDTLPIGLTADLSLRAGVK